MALIIPIFKPINDPGDIANYRPISHLNSISNLMEKMESIVFPAKKSC